jgi:hypothetical protein
MKEIPALKHPESAVTIPGHGEHGFAGNAWSRDEPVTLEIEHAIAG